MMMNDDESTVAKGISSQELLCKEHPWLDLKG